MFLRFIKAKGYEYLVLVENYREAGKHRQRVIRRFGRRDVVDFAEVRKELAQLPGFAFMKTEDV